MLSIEDIYREIGKNIYICPLNIDNFRDNSIDLTASTFAWSSDGNNIFDEKTRLITVPKHKTACILTKEAIYVSAKIGGTYHSRVSLAKKGFGHMGTMLDPGYCGQSLILLHNTTETDLTIKENERIVSVVFYYLKTPIGEKILATPPSHIEKIVQLDPSGKYRDWCEKNPWANNPQKLKKHFEEQYLEDFKHKRNLLAQKKNFFSKLWDSRIGRTLIKYLMVLIALIIAFFFISHYYPNVTESDWATIIISALICLITMIASDISKKS